MKKATVIYALKEDSSNAPHITAAYTLPTKQALICYIMQDIGKNYDTCNYPAGIAGMRESKGRWYYDDIQGKRVLAAYMM